MSGAKPYPCGQRPRPLQFALRTMTELSVYVLLRAQTITINMPRGQNSQVTLRQRPARSAHGASRLQRLSPVSNTALRETRTTRPVVPTAVTAPRTTTPTTTDPTTTPTTTGRRITSRPRLRRRPRCTLLLLRSEPTTVRQNGSSGCPLECGRVSQLVRR